MVGGVTVPVVIHWPLVCVTSDQQRSRPLRISCGSAGTWRDLLLSTACSASQARALIGAITSRLVGLWLLRGCSVGTISILRLFGQCADLSNFIAAVLQVCSTLVNVTISRVVVSDTTEWSRQARRKAWLPSGSARAASEPAEKAQQSIRRHWFRPVVGAEIRVRAAVDENDATT